LPASFAVELGGARFDLTVSGGGVSLPPGFPGSAAIDPVSGGVILSFDARAGSLRIPPEAGARDAGFATLGLSICYDVRFAHLYRALAQAGAQVLTVPAAFSPVTGAAHWETLLRARAIETGCYVLAPAQTGQHPQTTGRQRRTHGHALAIAPWGEVLGDAGTEPGMVLVDLDMAQVASARGRVPALTHDRPYHPPQAVG
jgi:predicted amidohydrolase